MYQQPKTRAFLLLCFALIACGQSSTKNSADDSGAKVPQQAQSPIQAQATTHPAATPSASLAASTEVPQAKPPAYPQKSIQSGESPEASAWLPAFSVMRQDGDLGVTMLAAQDACATRGMALCTETQWARGCAEDSALGAIETWTSSAAADQGFVVRGGQGCIGRKVVPGTDTSPFRAGVCCERAVGITTSNKSKAFMMATSEKLLAFEKALNGANTGALRGLFDDQVTFYGKSYDSSKLMATYDGYFREHRPQWTHFERCEVTLQSATETWTAECTTTSRRGTDVASVIQRQVRGGPKGLIRLVEDAKVFRKFSPLLHRK